MTRLREERLIDTRWMARGACMEHPGLPWTEGLNRVPEVLVEIMRELCDGCPVREECAAFVVEAEVTAGWWAGQSLNRFTTTHPPTAADMHDGIHGGVRGEVA